MASLLPESKSSSDMLTLFPQISALPLRERVPTCRLRAERETKISETCPSLRSGRNVGDQDGDG